MKSISDDHKTYRTKPLSVSYFRKIFPSLSFYPGFFSIVIKFSLVSKRGNFTNDGWWASSIGVLRALESVGVTMEINGLDNIRSVDGPVVFIGNHLSMLETVVLPAILLPYKPITYVVKQSLLDYPVFKHVMRASNPVAVSRTNPRHDLKVVLEQGQQRLASGTSMIIFPQTTRTTFDPKQFSSIGIKLARKAGVPVIPLALLTDAWENGNKIKDLGRIVPPRKAYFSFGEKLEISGKGTTEHQGIIDFIEDHLNRWTT